MRCIMQVIIIPTHLVNAHTFTMMYFLQLKVILRTILKWTKKCLKKSTLLLHLLLRYMCHISCPRINFHKFDSGP